MSTHAGDPADAPELLRGDFAPDSRTLVDILRTSAGLFPDAVALDDGTRELSYSSLILEAESAAHDLIARGVGSGDRVGIRIPSGTADLYIWILGALLVGAAYVPVDFEDPPERASLVFSEAEVSAVVGEGGRIESSRDMPVQGAARRNDPRPDDDAWVIFTSGSTGTPKGVAVTHRSAAAFADAEARIFLQAEDTEPLGPEDRVLAGLSVAFDASCEEMWLAWRHGAALVPAPRSLVRTGVDLGPWLVAQQITVVSTVPTLAALWPVHALDAVRLLIFGGEACPPELAERLVYPGREVWNTYGPTEATVVACAAPMTGQGPIRIGLPLDGWDLAVVDAAGFGVAEGETGELIIGGVGLARYLDAEKDAQKFAPMPQLGWSRAYRSGDLVRYESEGLVFLGRADEQIKLGGRRIELGEVDSAMQALRGVAGAAAAIRTTPAGNQILVGYLAVENEARDFDVAAATVELRELLPATMVPMLTIVDSLPTRTSGKVDRDALPWPLQGSADEPDVGDNLSGTAAWIAQQWRNILGAAVSGADDDFFAHGGGSLTAAQLVSILRSRFPEATVADIYAAPQLGALAAVLDAMVPAGAQQTREVTPTPLRAQLIQAALTVPLITLTGLRWLTWLMALNNILSWFGNFPWAPVVSWWWVLLGTVIFLSPPGRMAVTVAGARLLLRKVEPGTFPRGGSVHLRIWCCRTLGRGDGSDQSRGGSVDRCIREGVGRQNRRRYRSTFLTARHRDADVGVGQFH
nr:non-ribosomal peptide synthetase [Nakamurella antarctica]